MHSLSFTSTNFERDHRKSWFPQGLFSFGEVQKVSYIYIYLLSLIFMVPFVSVVYKSWLIIYYLFFFSLKNTYVLSSREFTVVSACFRTPHPPLPSLVHHPKHLTTFSQRFIQRCKVIRVHLRHTLMSNHSFWLTSG